MKKLSFLLCATAMACCLASCAKSISKDEASTIASNWSVSTAQAEGYQSMVYSTKNSDGSTSTKNYSKDDLYGTFGQISVTLTTSKAAVAYASTFDSATYKSGGTDLEINYKAAEGSTAFTYKMNSVGLMVYAKSVDSSGSWTEINYKWSK